MTEEKTRVIVTIQGIPRISDHRQELGRAKQGFSSELQREHGPAATLTVGPLVSRTGESPYLLFSATSLLYFTTVALQI